MSSFVGSFLLALLLPLGMGWPVALRLGFTQGLRSIAMAAACGLSILLIVCRGVQVLSGTAPASGWLLLGYVAATGIFWMSRRTLQSASSVLKRDGSKLVLLGFLVAAVTIFLNIPIVFEGAIQFDGSLNADSVIFAANARYMLHHVFNGAPDFSQTQPIYAITRAYIGSGAMQPRPAAEGFLAWLSALIHLDPLYLYNAVQSAAVSLAGITVFAFIPPVIANHSGWTILFTLIVTLGCPALLYIAINSNFANGFALVPATAYVAVAVMPRSRGTAVVAVLCMGCLLSGYPELIVFVGAIRLVAILAEAIMMRKPTRFVREGFMLLAELVVACVLLPWAAKGAWTVYKTAFTLSHQSTDLSGDIYAGVPLAVTAAILLCLAWSKMRVIEHGGKLRSTFVAILIVFTLAQLYMLKIGFSYGGFKLCEYFVTSFLGIIATSGALIIEAARKCDTPPKWKIRLKAGITALAYIALSMVWHDVRFIRRSWDYAAQRRITPDMLAMSHWLKQIAPDAVIAIGHTPASFYYGHWLPYISDAHFVFDMSDPAAAGYLRPYLQAGNAQAYSGADYRLMIDDLPSINAHDVAKFGAIRLVRRGSE